jgi:DNA polymerase III delta prime subunit
LRHLILVDQADTLTKVRQIGLRSRIEPHPPQEIIWVFTATEIDELDDGFRSRCHHIKFSNHGNAKDAALLLERIWNLEAEPGSPAPNFSRIVKDSNGTFGPAINRVELKIAGG